MVLADAEQAVARGIEAAAGVAQRAFRRDGDGVLSGLEAVEALVREVREPQPAAGHQQRTAAVLLHPRAHVPGRRQQFLRVLPLAPAHDRVAPPFLGT